MTDEFCDGFEEGYKTIQGEMVLVPLCPLEPLAPLGSNSYREGIKPGLLRRNRFSGKRPLCIVVDHDLTHEEMNAHYRAMIDEGR